MQVSSVPPPAARRTLAWLTHCGPRGRCGRLTPPPPAPLHPAHRPHRPWRRRSPLCVAVRPNSPPKCSAAARRCGAAAARRRGGAAARRRGGAAARPAGPPPASASAALPAAARGEPRGSRGGAAGEPRGSRTRRGRHVGPAASPAGLGMGAGARGFGWRPPPLPPSPPPPPRPWLASAVGGARVRRWRNGGGADGHFGFFLTVTTDTFWVFF